MDKQVYLPNELLDLIFSFDGRIEWRKGKFINIISKNDPRRSQVENIVIRKINILKRKMVIDKVKNEFFFDYRFVDKGMMGLCFDYRWSYTNTDKFEICFYNFNNEYSIQKRFIVK